MKLYSIMLFNKVNDNAVTLASAYYLNDFMFWERSSARDIIRFVSREVVNRLQLGSRDSIIHQGHLCHAYVRFDNLSCAIISDEEYPQRVVFTLIHDIINKFEFKEFPWKNVISDTEFTFDCLKELLIEFQDPKEADKLLKIQEDLDQTKETVIRTIDQLFDRGEKLEILAAKSDDLSFQSRVFVDKSKDMNSCCVIL